MPRKDGTGPIGFGAMTGRGLGLGLGYGCRRGRFNDIVSSDLNERELLSAQKDLLEARLETINKYLNKKQDIDK